MKTIIENGKANYGIQSCSISGCGIEIIFHNNDLADKFASSLIPLSISYTKSENKITVFCIN